MKRYGMLIMVILLAAMLSGCSGSADTFVMKSYISGAEEIKEISIDVRDREIEVSLSEDAYVHIDYWESEKDYYHIVLSADHSLSITTADKKGWTDYIGRKSSTESRTISVRIPNTLLSTITLSTTNEDIRISSLIVKDTISISNNGGNITFDEVGVGNALLLKAKNGDIYGAVVGSADDFSIECNVKKGKSNITSVDRSGKKTLKVSNNHGDVEIAFVLQ